MYCLTAFAKFGLDLDRLRAAWLGFADDGIGGARGSAVSGFAKSSNFWTGKLRPSSSGLTTVLLLLCTSFGKDSLLTLLLCSPFK